MNNTCDRPPLISFFKMLKHGSAIYTIYIQIGNEYSGHYKIHSFTSFVRSESLIKEISATVVQLT